MKIPTSLSGKALQARKNLVALLTLIYASLFFAGTVTPAFAWGFHSSVTGGFPSHSSYSHSYSSPSNSYSSSSYNSVSSSSSSPPYVPNYGSMYTSFDDYFWGGPHKAPPSLFDPRYWPSMDMIPTRQAMGLPDSSSGVGSFDLKNGPLKATIDGWHDRTAEPAKLPLLTLFHSVEEKIIRMHEYDEIGSFDIDEFSQELLAIK
ncbi:MAG: hypothetical protein K2X81_21575, partial [Candidatus Obscuribacterales bacterium]|nr:hypothetical protein [Candidatus Obscuribacterales bacterium]